MNIILNKKIKMLSKTLSRVCRGNQLLFAGSRAMVVPSARPVGFISTPCLRHFSAAPPEEGQEQAASTIPEPTEAEKEKGRQEWGIKYDDECLKFEKEWELIAKSVVD